ncbi:DedA family protein [Catenuloplanes japonicus]|uniref:DedA family protein n=1 Tax=Catenuloplanes japonicus TaxID=33876 RepID=UPI00068FDF18|nr:VTT domain-containing protein [Catenuloplanes japonicus]
MNLLEHPYALLGPLVLVEGPAATVTAGSLVGAGLARFWPVLAIVVLADLAGDTVLYLLGRFSHHPRAAALLRRLGLSDARRARFTTSVTRSLPRLVLTAKVADFLAIPAYVSAGVARIPYQRFVAWVAAGAAARAAVLIGAGALIGSRFHGNVLLLTTVVAVAALILQVGFQRLLKQRKGEPCASSSVPRPTLRTSTALPTSPSVSPTR